MAGMQHAVRDRAALRSIMVVIVNWRGAARVIVDAWPLCMPPLAVAEEQRRYTWLKRGIVRSQVLHLA